MGFDEALKIVKAGGRVTRKYMMCSHLEIVHVADRAATESGLQYYPAVYLCTERRHMAPYGALSDDLLAEDWEVVGELSTTLTEA
jgi:hypothetical protein